MAECERCGKDIGWGSGPYCWRCEEEIERQKEQNRLLERQNELLEEQEFERKREQEREQDQRIYVAAHPSCKYCGNKFDYDSNAVYEYCCKRCAIDDLGVHGYKSYISKGSANFLRMLNNCNDDLAKLIISDQIDDISILTVEQRFELAELNTKDWPCRDRNSSRAADFIDEIFGNLSTQKKVKMIKDFLNPSSKYNSSGYWRNVGYELLERYCVDRADNELISAFSHKEKKDFIHRYSGDDDRLQFVFRCAYFKDMDLSHKKWYALELIHSRVNDWDSDLTYGILFMSLIFECIGNSDRDFTSRVMKSVAMLKDDELQSYGGGFFYQIIQNEYNNRAWLESKIDGYSHEDYCKAKDDEAANKFITSETKKLFLFLALCVLPFWWWYECHLSKILDGDVDIIGNPFYFFPFFLGFIPSCYALSNLVSIFEYKSFRNQYNKWDKDIAKRNKKILSSNFVGDGNLDELNQAIMNLKFSLDLNDFDIPSEDEDVENPVAPSPIIKSLLNRSSVMSEKQQELDDIDLAEDTTTPATEEPPKSEQFKIYCPHCNQKYIVESDWAGMEATCDKCNNSFTIPHLK